MSNTAGKKRRKKKKGDKQNETKEERTTQGTKLCMTREGVSTDQKT